MHRQFIFKRTFFAKFLFRPFNGSCLNNVEKVLLALLLMPYFGTGNDFYHFNDDYCANNCLFRLLLKFAFLVILILFYLQHKKLESKRRLEKENLEFENKLLSSIF